jgi:hypothetical protein
MSPGCSHHEAVNARLDAGEKDRVALWTSVDEIRRDIQGIIWKIGFIVGGITAVNSIIIIFLK